MFSNIKAIIFDLDGTLADTIWQIREGANDARAEVGLSPVSYEDIKKGINAGVRQLVVTSIIDPARADDEAHIDDMQRRYLAAYGRVFDRTDKPYDGISEVVSCLKSRGYKLAVLSNKPDEFVRVLASKLFPERGETNPLITEVLPCSVSSFNAATEMTRLQILILTENLQPSL